MPRPSEELDRRGRSTSRPVPGAECFVVHAVHVVIDVDEDGWLVVEAGSVAATAAGEHTCALGEGVCDVALDDLELRRKVIAPTSPAPAGVLPRWRRLPTARTSLSTNSSWTSS
jgi:hypothetical protein